jgi:hypothetical protein
MERFINGLLLIFTRVIGHMLLLDNVNQYTQHGTQNLKDRFWLLAVYNQLIQIKRINVFFTIKF